LKVEIEEAKGSRTVSWEFRTAANDLAMMAEFVPKGKVGQKVVVRI
jgi:hypothetical protein